MKLDLGAATLLALLGFACAAPAGTPSRAPARADRPVLHAALVQGPFPDEATICRTIYSGGPDCLRRTPDVARGPRITSANGFGRVEIVDAWVGDHRCAVLFEIAGRLYVHTAPAFCLSQGHTLYLPTVKELAVRDLDGVHPPDVAIITEVEIARDEVEGAPVRDEPPIPPRTIAMFCGRRGGSTPSCVEVTTSDPTAFAATHELAFE